MTFDWTRAFETDNGVILDAANGVGIFSGNGSPVGTDAPVRSYYFDKADGLMWFKYGNLVGEWREVRPEFGVDNNNILTTTKDGYGFNKQNPERLCVGHIEGSSFFPANTGFKFYVLAQQSGSGSVDIQLYDLNANQVIAGPINFTETALTLKSAMIPDNLMPVNDVAIEIQGSKNGNSTGTIFWSSIESKRTGL